MIASRESSASNGNDLIEGEPEMNTNVDTSASNHDQHENKKSDDCSLIKTLGCEWVVCYWLSAEFAFGLVYGNGVNSRWLLEFLFSVDSQAEAGRGSAGLGRRVESVCGSNLMLRGLAPRWELGHAA
jgi:hypothetical protein